MTPKAKQLINNNLKRWLVLKQVVKLFYTECNFLEDKHV